MNFIGDYRTKSGYFYFRFSFEQQANGEVRAYIIRAPSYAGRPTDGHSTHRYHDGRYYICYEPMPGNFKDAIAVAKEWAECTENYILYGDNF